MISASTSTPIQVFDHLVAQTVIAKKIQREGQFIWSCRFARLVEKDVRVYSRCGVVARGYNSPAMAKGVPNPVTR